MNNSTAFISHRCLERTRVVEIKTNGPLHRETSVANCNCEIGIVILTFGRKKDGHTHLMLELITFIVLVVSCTLEASRTTPVLSDLMVMKDAIFLVYRKQRSCYSPYC